jgi:hypothetical protein
MELAFPDIKKFDELFEAHSDDKSSFENIPLHSDEVEGQYLTPFCSLRNFEEHYSMYVKPSAAVVDFVKNSTIGIEYDHMFFQIIRRSKDECLVTVSYSQIIGSRWIATIDTSSVPS